MSPGNATLAGVLLAVLIPTRPPANLNALLGQAATVIHQEDRRAGEAMRPGPSEPALRKLDAIHDRIDSLADKLLRTVEPRSSYVVLPIFALANAGVAWSPDVFRGYGRLMLAVMLGLVVGKSIGIVAAAWLALRSGIATKPDAYSWRQLVGAGALGGIGFTMSLFIAGQACPDPADYEDRDLHRFPHRRRARIPHSLCAARRTKRRGGDRRYHRRRRRRLILRP